MLAHARQHLNHRCSTLDLRWDDIRRLPFADESFDTVIFAHVLEHLADPVETLREMVRVLKPGAPLIGSVTRKGLGQHRRSHFGSGRLGCVPESYLYL